MMIKISRAVTGIKSRVVSTEERDVGKESEKHAPTRWQKVWRERNLKYNLGDMGMSQSNNILVTGGSESEKIGEAIFGEK